MTIANRYLKMYVLLFLVIINTSHSLLAGCPVSNSSTIYPPNGANIAGSFTISGLSSGNYKLIATQAGQFTINNLQFYVNGITQSNGSIFPLSSGSNSLTLGGWINRNVGCGLSTVITFKLYLHLPISGDVQVCQFTHTVNTAVLGSISGPVTLCQTSPGTYVATGIFSNVAYEWSSTSSDFRLNGQNTWPISTVSPTVQIQAINPGSSTTISVIANGGAASCAISTQITSNNPVVSLASSSECASSGNAIDMWNANGTSGTYTWQRSSSNPYSWTTIGSATSPSFSYAVATTPTQGQILYFRAKVDDGTCVSAYSSPIIARWCKNDGEYCECRNRLGQKITELGNTENELSLHPNPARDQINLELTAADKYNAQYAILDISGRIVLQGEIKVNNGMNYYTITTAELQNGIYMLKINGVKGIKKILIQR